MAVRVFQPRSDAETRNNDIYYSKFGCAQADIEEPAASLAPAADDSSDYILSEPQSGGK